MAVAASAREYGIQRFRVVVRHGTEPSKGFTLVELLITVAVVAVLAAIAFPAYQEQVRSTRRAEARAALQEIALRQQAFFLDNRTFTATLGAGGVDSATKTGSGFYDLAVTNPTGCPIGSCYRLEATPNGVQADDSCGILVLTSVGTKLPANCW